MDQIDVSICISVHNTDAYLRRCLDSVINQTLNNKEIILVNNGSTDNSLNIMLEYQNNFPEIVKVISQEDKGLAQGRQTGIDNSKGKYITFLDADDYIKIEAYEIMFNNALKYDADIVECQTQKDGIIIDSPYKGVYDTKEILSDYLKNGNIPTMLWMRLYKKQLFSKPVLPNLYTNNEDNFALPCLLYNARNIVFIKEHLHYYSTDNEHAVMAQINKRTADEAKIIRNRTMALKAIDHIKNYIGEDTIKKCYAKEFNLFIARIILSFCLYDFRELSIDDRIMIVCNILKIECSDLDMYYRNFKNNNKKLQFLLRMIGIRKTLLIINYFKKAQAKMKGWLGA